MPDSIYEYLSKKALIEGLPCERIKMIRVHLLNQPN